MSACVPSPALVRPGGPNQVRISHPELGDEEDEGRPSAALGELASLAAVDDDAALDADHGGDDETYRPGVPLSINARMSQRCHLHRSTLEQAAERAGVDPLLLLALAWVESGFNPAAESGAGARGIMQMMPATASSLGCDDPRNPSCAASAAAAYVSRLLARYRGDLVYALCAYNAGTVRPSRARRRGELPFNMSFATKVMEARSRLERFGCAGK